MKRTLVGPHGIKLILDSSEINLDNPGDGTPALVNYKGGSASFNCAIGEGEVDAMGRIIQIPQEAIDWLNDQESQIDAMYDNFMKEREKGS